MKIQKRRIAALRGRYSLNGGGIEQRLEIQNGGFCNTLTTVQKDNYLIIEYVYMNNLDNIAIRKLTPRECYRLMGVPDNKIDTLLSCGLAKGAHYKLAGNSIVVNVMAAIFRKLWVDKEPEQGQQLQIF